MIIVYGPRQVGKTTLSLQITSHFSDKKTLYISGDDIETQETRKPSLRLLSAIVSDYDIIIIDEAQKIKNIGLILKILVDQISWKQYIATGSSSFDLAYSVSEPLTGRSFIYHLYPLSLQELYQQQPLTTTIIEQRMIYGSYPETITGSTSPESYLRSLFDNYLYKDILTFEWIQKHSLIIKLIQALALQIGNEFSYSELANTLGSNKDTIAKYVLILEQAFIIKTLAPLYSNKRREIKWHKKVYFYDLWVRNVAINNFNPLSMRSDVGQLWENLCYIERTKYISYHQVLCNQNFWRQTAGPEIDYIEHYNGHYDCYEFKYSPKKWWSLPVWFAWAYPNHSYQVIRTDNIGDFVRSPLAL